MFSSQIINKLKTVKVDAEAFVMILLNKFCLILFKFCKFYLLKTFYLKFKCR